MFRSVSLTICLLAGVFLFPAFAARAAVEAVDDTGAAVSLERPAKRVIPLYGAFAEMLYAVNAGAAVCARTQADQYPPQIRELPSVGTHMHPNVEMILGLKPDLVIFSATRKEETEEAVRLRHAGVPVAIFAPKSFDDVFSVMKRLGVLTGHAEEAEDAVRRLRGRLEAVAERLKSLEERRKVFFEVRAEPLTGAGAGSIVQEILSSSGAENSLKSERAIVLYNFEALLLNDPDVYIVQKGPMNRNPLEPKKRAHFDRLRAVREGRVLSVDEFLYSRPGPRCVDAVEQLAAALYPDRFVAGR
ncbi:MAG: helical backbone metal receptor [Syntrophobacteraceae bacterium]